MSLVHQCDRCKAISNLGNIDDPPDDWLTVYRPVRGSSGARSADKGTLCAACDDDLYRWWHDPADREETNDE